MRRRRRPQNKKRELGRRKPPCRRLPRRNFPTQSSCFCNFTQIGIFQFCKKEWDIACRGGQKNERKIIQFSKMWNVPWHFPRTTQQHRRPCITSHYLNLSLYHIPCWVAILSALCACQCLSPFHTKKRESWRGSSVG
jgi:hypothetical protein